MSRIRWTTEAADELEAAVKYIQQDNSDAAQKLAQTLIHRIERLKSFPEQGAREKSAARASLLLRLTSWYTV